LRAPIARGLEIIEALQGSLSGHAVPHYVVDVAGAGKMPLAPQRYTHSVDGYHHFINFRGEHAQYFDSESAALYDSKHELNAKTSTAQKN
jgi:lysine 2,3-aminomutase